MRKIESFSVFKMTSEDRFEFSPVEYSKFKYGSKRIALKFGYALADQFILKYSSLFGTSQIVVIPSAFSHVQTASCIMESFFVDRLNSYLFSNKYSPVEQAKIYRTVSYREDYGEISAEDRFNLIKEDRFHIDKSLLGNKILIFIDDVKITGTHERIILKMLDDYEIKNDCFMLYFAELDNTNLHPRIENYLNQYFIKSLSDLDYLIKNEPFVFNTRIIKFILNSTHDDCKNFLNHHSIEFIKELFFLAVGNSYGQFAEYKRNLFYIQNLVRDKTSKNFSNNILMDSESFITF